MQTVKDIADSRFDWEQALRDLSRAIPADVTLKALNGDISTTAGGSSSSLRGAISAPAITIQGCASGQTGVARLMARLRDIDGVTRVSLSKSDSEKVAAGGDPSGSAIERRNAMPCGTGKRPSFEVVMFFEKATAAVSGTPTTAGGTVSAAPTPTPTATASATPEGTSASTAPQGGATP